MIGLLPSLNRAWRRAPSGYRPGAALDRLARNLEPYACERLAPSLLRLTLPQGPDRDRRTGPGAVYGAYRQPPLSVAGPVRDAASADAGRGDRRLAAAARVRYLLRQRHAAAQRVLDGLQRYPQIGETLAQLDFRRVRLTVNDGVGRWRLSISPHRRWSAVCRPAAATGWMPNSGGCC